MKKTKLYFGEKRLKDIYVGASKWEVFKYKTARLTKRVLVVMFAMSVIGWSVYAGSQYIPRTVFAEKEVIVKEGIKFEDIPMLVKICKAESGNRQFNKNGDVLRGKVNPSDLGYCQINEYIHNDEARRLGYDIYTEKGNKDFAVHLFLEQGTAPWNSSKVIWSK